MSLSDTLQRRISEALEAVYNSPLHDLRPGYRYAIYDALGPRDEPEQNFSKGHKLRANLAIHTVRKVLPLWETRLPNDNIPHILLEKAENIINGVLDVRAGFQILAGIIPLHTSDEKIDPWTYMDNAAYNTRVENVLQSYVDVGRAAIKALEVAIKDESFGSDNIDYMANDFDLEFYEHDTVFFAATAYANGSSWTKTSDPEKREEFWKWWLTDAVTSVWNTVV